MNFRIWRRDSRRHIFYYKSKYKNKGQCIWHVHQAVGPEAVDQDLAVAAHAAAVLAVEEATESERVRDLLKIQENSGIIEMA